MAIVPILGDVDAAVAEIHRAASAGLRGGILIPAMWRPYPPYHHPRYEPVWSVCEELDLPVHVHSGAADRESYGEEVGLCVAEVRWWTERPLWFLYLGKPTVIIGNGTVQFRSASLPAANQACLLPSKLSYGMRRSS